MCDDAAFLADLGGAPRVQGLARAWHLRPDTLRAFPAAAPRGSSATAPLVPALAVFPEIAPRPQTRVEPVEPAEALGRLVEASALVVVDGAARAPEHLALLGRIASEVPAVRVALGRDLLETPAAVARALLRAAGW